MKSILMFPVRVLFLPIMILLKITSWLTKGIVIKASGIMTLFGILLAILSVYAFCISIPQAGVLFLLGAFLLSPLGIPMVAILISMLPETLYHGLKKLIF